MLLLLLLLLYGGRVELLLCCVFVWSQQIKLNFQPFIRETIKHLMCCEGKIRQQKKKIHTIKQQLYENKNGGNITLNWIHNNNNKKTIAHIYTFKIIYIHTYIRICVYQQHHLRTNARMSECASKLGLLYSQFGLNSKNKIVEKSNQSLSTAIRI